MIELNSARKRRPGAYFLALLAVIAASMIGLVGVITPASAAPPYDSTGTVSNVQFTQTSVASGNSAQLSADWSIADNPTTPAGFILPLPAELQASGYSFELKDPKGAVVGTCVAAATQLQCDLDPAYVAANPKGLHGTVNFWVKVTTQVTSATETTYEFGTVTAKITVTPATPVGPCVENCEFTGQNNGKSLSSFNYVDGTALWAVRVGAPATGMAGGESVTITDRPDDNQQVMSGNGMPKLLMSNQTGANAQGAVGIVDWQGVPLTDYTISAAGDEIKFVAQKGYFYFAYFQTKLIDGGQAVKYTNNADITVGTQTPVTVQSQVTYRGGSGTGIGTNVGVFTITKALTGDTEGVADQPYNYTGTYAVTAPDGTVSDGTYSVQAGQTWTSPQFPRDSTVVLTEDAPTEPSNITWASPSFSTNNFTLPGGESTPVTLTNNATVKMGTFTASKKVDAVAALVAAIPAGATVTVDYTYPAGIGFAAGSGSMVLPLDGRQVTSPELPVGAVLTFKELTPEAIEGMKWGTPVMSPSSLTIGDGNAAALIVTNPLTATSGEVVWTKVDGAGTALAGSEWSLTGPEGAVLAVADNGTNDADPTAGALKVTDLAWGTYTLKETKAPTGYELSTETKTVVIDAKTLSASFGAVVNKLTPTTPSTTPPVVSTTPPTPPATTPPAVPGTPSSPAAPPLAYTGVNSGVMFASGAALLLLTLGGLLLVPQIRSRRH